MQEDKVMKKLRQVRKKIEAERLKKGESISDYLIRIEKDCKGKLVDLSSKFKKSEFFLEKKNQKNIPV